MKYTTTILALTNVFEVTIVQGGVSPTRRAFQRLCADGRSQQCAMDLKTLNLDPKDHLGDRRGQRGNGRRAAQVQPDDEIVALAGTPISSHDELTNLVQACGGKKTPLVVKRGNEKR
jgi:hypothetical protein